MAGIQIGGIASGFDTTSMIEELMKAERTKVDKVSQQKNVIEFQKEIYTSINDKYSDFILKMRKTFGLEGFIGTSGLTRPGAMSGLSWLNKATSSNESVVSAKASSGAKPGNYEITVNQVADNVKFASSENIELDPTKPLSEQGMTDLKLTVTTKNGSVTIEDTDGTMTLDSLAKELNNIDGVSASYDSTLNRFFLQTDATGAENFIQISDDNNSGILSGLKLDDQMSSGTKYTGVDANIDFNGAKGITFSSNNFNIQGIDFNVKNVGEKVSVVVDTDTDAVVEKVNVFVEEYNTLVKEIGDILSEPRYRDYAPLTDAQKKEMTEKEIELWEQKAKSGLIRNDSIVNKVQQSLREALLQPVVLADGTKVSLADFGIEGKGYFEGGKNGELKIDEKKLREAVANNSDQFMQVMFATPSDSTLNTADRNLSQAQIKEKRSQCGIFNRMTDVMVEGMSQIINKAGVGSNSSVYREVNSFILVDFTKNGSQSLLDNRILDFNKRIDTLNMRLAKTESRYWNQFTAMEKALANMQSQQSAFMSGL